MLIKPDDWFLVFLLVCSITGHLPLHSPCLPSAAALFLFVLLITTCFYWVNYKLEFHFQTQAALSAFLILHPAPLCTQTLCTSLYTAVLCGQFPTSKSTHSDSSTQKSRRPSFLPNIPSTSFFPNKVLFICQS